MDDFLGLAVPAAGQVIGHQGTHPRRVGVIGQHPPRVRRVQVRFAEVAVGQPLGPDRPEEPTTPRSWPFSTVPCRIPAALVTCSIRFSRSQSMVKVASSSRRCCCRPDSSITFSRSPLSRGRHLAPPRTASRRIARPAGQRRRQLLIHRARAPVLADPRHRNCQLHRRASVACRGPFSLHDRKTGPGTGGPGNRTPPSTRHQQPVCTTTDQHRSPSARPESPTNVETRQISTSSGGYQRNLTTLKKMHLRRPPRSTCAGRAECRLSLYALPPSSIRSSCAFPRGSSA